MRKTITTLLGAWLLLHAGSALGAQDGNGEAITEPSFQGFSVQKIGDFGEVEVTQRAGREELVLTRSSVMLEGAGLSEGVIEFDVAFDARRGFGGLMWHVGGPDDFEYFYLRKHKSGLPDAGQYTPTRHGLTAWQIFSDENATAPFAFTHDGWNRIRFVIADDVADIYFNGSSRPILHVPDLATDRGSGGIGFRTSGPNGALRISNLVIRPLVEGEGIVGTPRAVPEPPAGAIRSWDISSRFAESALANQLTLPAEIAGLPSMAQLGIEPTGIVDISRAAGPEDGADTVLVSTRIRSDSDRRVRMRFGYSDRVRLYLNGALVFDGAAGFRERDFFFLGTVGFCDAVVLHLREGENVLSAAVSETFGGWAFAAAIADDEGLQIRP